MSINQPVIPIWEAAIPISKEWTLIPLSALIWEVAWNNDTSSLASDVKAALIGLISDNSRVGIHVDPVVPRIRNVINAFMLYATENQAWWYDIKAQAIPEPKDDLCLYRVEINAIDDTLIDTFKSIKAILRSYPKSQWAKVIENIVHEFPHQKYREFFSLMSTDLITWESRTESLVEEIGESKVDLLWWLFNKALQLLDQRSKVAQDVGRYKTIRGREKLDIVRWNEHIKAVQLRWTLDFSDGVTLDTNIVKWAWDVIHKHSLQLERDLDAIFHTKYIQAETWTLPHIYFEVKESIVTNTWHFGKGLEVVPWVCTGELIRQFLDKKIGDQDLEMSFKGTCRPADLVSVEEGNLVRHSMNGISPLIETKVKPLNLKYLEQLQNLSEQLERTIGEWSLEIDNVDIIDIHLPQKPPFRFVTSARWIESDTPKILWMSKWYWDVPDDFILTPAIVEESAAQILSLASSKQQNPEWYKTGSILLYQKSHTHREPFVNLNTVKQIRVVGIKKQERTLRWQTMVWIEYHVTDQVGNLLLLGDIMGNQTSWNDFEAMMER